MLHIDSKSEADYLSFSSSFWWKNYDKALGFCVLEWLRYFDIKFYLLWISALVGFSSECHFNSSVPLGLEYFGSETTIFSRADSENSPLKLLSKRFGIDYFDGDYDLLLFSIIRSLLLSLTTIFFNWFFFLIFLMSYFS